MSRKRRIKRSNSTYVENPSVLDFEEAPTTYLRSANGRKSTSISGLRLGKL